MASHIERRKFLATLGGTAAAWPRAARAQQGKRMRQTSRLGHCKAGFEKALFVYPDAHLEKGPGSFLKSKKEPRC